MKVLVFGGSGQLGSEIRARWASDTIVSPSHDAARIEDIDTVVGAFDAVHPDLVVNCAAFHNVDLCEAEPETAMRINAQAVGDIAAACAARDIAFLTISTDYVFDGKAQRPYTETDEPNPLSAYGRSKLAGERLALQNHPGAFVVRTCGVYGRRASRSKGTFIDRVIAQARAGEPIRVVNDVIASPTYAGHLADALRAIVAARAHGLTHAVNVGAVSWFEFASRALALAGLSYPIEPIASTQWKAAARRPAYSALADARLSSLGHSMPSWEEGIAAYLRER